MSRANSTPDRASLLGMPPEIRNQIYAEILTATPIDRATDERYNILAAEVPENESNGLFKWVYPKIFTPPDPPIDYNLSFLLTCCQIRDEAFHMPFYLNNFSFRNTDELFTFLTRIGSARRQELRSIRFIWRGSDPAETFRLLKTCGNLAHMQIILLYKTLLNRDGDSGIEALMGIQGLESVEIQSLMGSYSEEPYYGKAKALRERLRIAMQKPRFLLQNQEGGE